MSAKKVSKKVTMGTIGSKTDKQLLAKYILINTNNLYLTLCMNYPLNLCLRLTSALILFLLLSTYTHAQQGALQYVKSGGGGGGFIGSNSSSPDPDEIYGSAIDMDGNIIVGGACTWAPRFDSIHFDYMIGTPYNAWDSAEVFLQPGTHNICVTVTDMDGCTATGCQSISIDSCNISLHYTDSSYWYTFYTTNGGVAPFQYQWQRSNSIFSYQDTTTTTLLPGLNTICVKVTDANGCVAWACEEITVGTDTCTASISYINTGNSYAFTASSTGTAPYTYKWRNNGGSVFGTAQNASIDLQSGSNNVCVTVTDANNCSATACQQVIISGITEDVQAGFSVYPNPVSDAVHIAIDAAQAGVVEITITDLQGRIISSGTREVIHGSNLLAYSTEQWAAGIYQLHILYSTQHYTAKLIKM